MSTVKHQASCCLTQHCFPRGLFKLRCQNLLEEEPHGRKLGQRGSCPRKGCGGISFSASQLLHSSVLEVNSRRLLHSPHAVPSRKVPKSQFEQLWSETSEITSTCVSDRGQMCTMHMPCSCKVPQRPDKGEGVPGTGVSLSCESPCRPWEPNLVLCRRSKHV